MPYARSRPQSAQMNRPLSPSKIEWGFIAFAWVFGIFLIAGPALSQTPGTDQEPIDIGLGDPEVQQEYSLKTTADGHLVKWQEQAFTFSVVPTSVLPSARVHTDLQASIAEWTNTEVVPDIDIDEEPGTVRSVEHDGVNSLFFVEQGWEFDPQIVALTFTHIRVRDGAIVEVDMAMNAEHFAFDAEGAGEEGDIHDLQSVFTHELGHAFGLPDFPRAPDATMYSVLDAGAIHPRELDAIDVTAVEELYFAEPEHKQTGPTGSCPSAPPTTFAGLLFFLFFRRRLTQARVMVGGTFALLLVAPMFSPTALATSATVGAGWVVEREAPRLSVGSMPATDVIVRTRDGRLMRVRLPGKATGDIQPRVLHLPIPERGSEMVVPASAETIDRTRQR